MTDADIKKLLAGATGGFWRNLCSTYQREYGLEPGPAERMTFHMCWVAAWETSMPSWELKKYEKEHNKWTLS